MSPEEAYRVMQERRAFLKAFNARSIEVVHWRNIARVFGQGIAQDLEQVFMQIDEMRGRDG